MLRQNGISRAQETDRCGIRCRHETSSAAAPERSFVQEPLSVPRIVRVVLTDGFTVARTGVYPVVLPLVRSSCSIHIQATRQRSPSKSHESAEALASKAFPPREPGNPATGSAKRFRADQQIYFERCGAGGQADDALPNTATRWLSFSSDRRLVGRIIRRELQLAPRPTPS